MTPSGEIEKVGIVGAGLVGSGWAVVFALAGLQVRVFDPDQAIAQKVLELAGCAMADMDVVGLATNINAALERISVCDSMAEAVGDADYVQEFSVRAGRREDRCFDLNRRSHPSRRNRRQFQLWHTRFGLHEIGASPGALSHRSPCQPSSCRAGGRTGADTVDRTGRGSSCACLHGKSWTSSSGGDTRDRRFPPEPSPRRASQRGICVT